MATNRVNIDDSQENADWAKYRQIDIPGVESIYDVLRFVGIDFSGEDGPQVIVDFAKSHPWLYTLNAETAWIIGEAEKAITENAK